MHSDQHTPTRIGRVWRRRFGAAAATSAIILGAVAWTAKGADPVAASAVVAPAGAGVRTIGAGADSYADVVAKVAPTVVTIRSEKRTRAPQQHPFMQDPWLREFFGDRFRDQLPAPDRRQGGLGSGVVVSGDGYILTNHHVIDGADEIRVELSDRRTLEAKVVGSDPPSDLAVLKIEATGLPVLSLGDSEQVRVGDVVLAVGNPMGVGQTVTMGIISAKGRATGLGDGSFEDFLQTDAPINSGNSGGALVNTRGELVGINSQILTPSGGNIGIGFAIPANMAQVVMRSLIDDGRVRRGLLGVTIQPVTSELARSLKLDPVAGALVNHVQPGGPADKAGLKRGDVITAINGNTIDDSNELRNQVAQLGPDTKAELIIVRNGDRKTLTATLDELPSNTITDTRQNTEAEEKTAGLLVEPLTSERAKQMGLNVGSGLIVRQVTPDGPAAEAGFRAGDVIQEVDGRAVASAAELQKSLQNANGRPALVLVHRGEHSLYLPLEPNNT